MVCNKGGNVSKLTSLVLLIPLVLVGCGIKPLDDLFNHDKGYTGTRHPTDLVFNSYLDILRSNGISTNTSVIFSTRNEGIAGTCTIYTNYRIIEIDKEYWENSTDTYRLELLAHEFGHCDYDLGHDDDETDSESPCHADSIMNPYNWGGSCFYNAETGQIDNYYLDIF